MNAATKKEPGHKPEAPAAAPARKAWIPKSPIDIMLDQIKKQEDRVAKLQTEIDAEKVNLVKLRKAKDILQAS